MNDMLRKYDQKIRNLLEKKPAGTDWKDVLKTHREMVAIAQHERLIHLLVMLTVAIITTLVFLTIITTGMALLLYLGIPLFGLLIGYIIHYRFLENTTQNWQGLVGKIKNNF